MSIEQLFINQISSVVVTGAFIFYLVRKDKSSKETYDRFSNVIENHLVHSTRITEKATKANVEIAKTLQKMCDLLQQLEKKQLNKK